MRFYFSTFRGLPVTMHLISDWKMRWTGIWGVQIGACFIGCIRGEEPKRVTRAIADRGAPPEEP